MIRRSLPDRRNRPPRRRRRWSVALVAVLLLALFGVAGLSGVDIARLAAPEVAADPADPAAVAPGHFTQADFVAADGVHLPLRQWLPRGRIKAVVLALHGFNDYSRAFAAPAGAWAERGIATFAYDQRGFGGAPGRGLWAGEGQLAVDAIVATRALRRAFPGRPVYLLGESMGGAIAILAATGTMSGVIPGPGGMPTADVDGIILSAPAVWGRAAMDLLPKVALFAAARLFPTSVLSGSGLGIRISDNDQILRELARDPMVIKGTRVEAVYGLVDLMDSALAAAPHVDVPMLLLYGAHDQVVPRRPVSEFVERLPPAPRQARRLAYYPAGYHLLLRDRGGSIVAGDVASWIRDPRAPLPSRADAGDRERPWPPPDRDERAASPSPPVLPAGLATGAAAANPG